MTFLNNDVLWHTLLTLAAKFDDVKHISVLACVSKNTHLTTKTFVDKYSHLLESELFRSDAHHEIVCLNPDCYWLSDPDAMGSDLYPPRHMAHEHQVKYLHNGPEPLHSPFCTQCTRKLCNVHIENPAECAVGNSFYVDAIRLRIDSPPLRFASNGVDKLFDLYTKYDTFWQNRLRNASQTKIVNLIYLICNYWDNSQRGDMKIFSSSRPNYSFFSHLYDGSEWSHIIRHAHSSAIKRIC